MGADGERCSTRVASSTPGPAGKPQTCSVLPGAMAASPLESAQTVASSVVMVVPRMTKRPCARSTEARAPRISAAESIRRATPLVKSALIGPVTFALMPSCSDGASSMLTATPAVS